MRRLLFLAYHFPPIGGAGVQRAARFARLLPEHGYEPVCVTGPGLARSRWAPEDKTLLDQIPRETEVHRVPGPEPLPLTGWRLRSQRWLALGDPWTRWWVEGVRTLGARLTPTTDLIYAWMQPYESAEAAVALAQASGKPWVADLGDPWALDEMMVYPTAAHRRRDLRQMRRRLGTASAIVMSTSEAAARLREAFPELRDTPVVAIPNGFDPLDFERPGPRRDDASFRIVHTGYLHTQLGRQLRRSSFARRLLGGDIPGVDIYTRSHVFLLEALRSLIEDDPELASTIELHLAGVLSQADQDVAAGSKLVHLHGFVTHGDSVALMRSADLLFLPMHDLPPGRRATIVPGKTYEYLASRRPILAAVPDGDARDLLQEAGSAFVCRPADAVAMASCVRDLIERHRAGEPAPAPDPELVSRYAYPRLAASLAAVFDGVLDDADPTPAAELADRVA